MDQTAQSEQPRSENKKTGKSVADLVLTIVLIVLCVLLLPLLIINITLIIKGNLHADVPPDVFGIAPLAVTSGSMDGIEPDSFGEGALIFVRILDDEEKQALQVGDIVTFRASDGAYVTHRIVSLNMKDSALESVTTRGDAMYSTDGDTLLGSVFGVCTGSIEGVGGFVLTLQRPEGILLFVGLPVLLLIGLDVVRIVLGNRRARAAAALEEKSDELESARSELRDKEEELMRLRALVGEQAAQSPAAQQAEGSGAPVQEKISEDPPENP